MPVSDEVLIDPNPVKPGIPLKKSTLIGIGGAIAVVACTAALFSAGTAPAPQEAPAQKSGAVQQTGKADQIDAEITDAERKRTDPNSVAKSPAVQVQNEAPVVLTPAPASSGAVIPAGQAKTSDLSQGPRGPGQVAQPGRPNITPASSGTAGGAPGQQAKTTGAIDAAARPLSNPKGRSVEEQASSLLSKSLAFDEGGSPQTLGNISSSGFGSATPSQRAASATSGIDRLLENATGTRNAATTSSSSAVDAALARAGASATASTADNRTFYQELEKEQHNAPIKTYPTASKFTLHQGKVIPAVLGRSLNSDVPGEITAYTTLDIYDSLGGGKLLLPKGSVLVGRYASGVKAGQERMMFAFQRLIMPNGQAFDLPAAPGSDMRGAAGVEGDVNNHFFKMFFSSLFVATLANEVKQPSSVTTIGGSGTTSPAGQVLVDVSKTILDRNRNIPPTITIDQGTRINVEVTRDMEFPGAYRR
jgi:type IV secretory pathway VirB10-like protein